MFKYIKELNYQRITFCVAVLLDILLVLFFALNWMSKLSGFWADKILNFFFFALAANTAYLAFKIRQIPLENRKDSMLVFFCRYCLFLFLIIIALTPYFQLNVITGIMPEIIGIAVALGFLTFFASHNNLEKELESERIKEGAVESKRAEEFDARFPRLARLNLGYGFLRVWRDSFILRRVLLLLLCVAAAPIVWGVRLFYKITRWSYKMGWAYSLGLAVIISVGFLLRVWNLGKLGFHGDEFFHQITADGIKETLLPFLPNHLLYTRGLFTSYLGAFGSNIFNGEFGYRIFPVIFSFILLIYSYFLTRKHFSRLVSNIYLIFILFEYWILEITRYFRFYSLALYSTICIILLLLDEDIAENNLKKIILLLLLFLNISESQTGFLIAPLVIITLAYYDLAKGKSFIKVFFDIIIFLLPVVLNILLNFGSSSLNSLSSISSDSSILKKMSNFVIGNISISPFFIKAFYYIYSLFFVFFIVICIISFFSKKRKLSFVAFSALFFLGCLTILKTKEQQRIFSFLLPLLFLISANFLAFAYNVYLDKKTEKISGFKKGIFLLILFSLMFYFSFTIPFINYGDLFNQDKILSSAEPFYPDYKTTSLYVLNNWQDEYVITSGPSVTAYYSYLAPIDKKYLFGLQSYKESVIAYKNISLDRYTGIEVITTKESLIKKLSERDSFLILSYSSFPVSFNVLDKYGVYSHLSSDIRSLVSSECELKYAGKDNVSKVYYCSKTTFQKF